MSYQYNQYPPNQNPQPPYGQPEVPRHAPQAGYPPYPSPPQQQLPQQQQQPPYGHPGYPGGYYPPQQGNYVPPPATYPGPPRAYPSGPLPPQPQPQQPAYPQAPYASQPGYSYPPSGPPYGGPPQQPPGPYSPPQNYPTAPPLRTQIPSPPQAAAPSLGYIPGHIAPGDFRPDADVLRQAMKGIGTDEATLIRVLARMDPLQVAAVRETYGRHIGRDLYKDIKSETSGYFQLGLLAIIDGPLVHDAKLVREAVTAGLGTTEWKLNDVLLGRSNADLTAIKTAYQQKFSRSLPRDVADDLSAHTERLFARVITATRHEESMLVHPQHIESDVKSINGAPQGRMVNNTAEVCTIFAQSSDAELRAINNAFRARYNVPLDKHIEREFSGHMEDALLRMLDTAIDPAMRDAVLLEECMVGAGTKDEKLTVRIVRMHWDRAHLDQVKRAYHHRYRRDLRDRVRDDLSGDYERLMLAMLD